MGLFLDNFVPCYFGQKIELRSDRFCEKVLHSNWIGGDHKFKKNMIILMENLKITHKFTAKGLIDINMSTFLKVKNYSF
jgi:hypothetical protein